MIYYDSKNTFFVHRKSKRIGARSICAAMSEKIIGL